MRVELSQDEWIRLLNCATWAPMREAAPVVIKVQEQLAQQVSHEGLMANGDGRSAAQAAGAS